MQTDFRIATVKEDKKMNRKIKNLLYIAAGGAGIAALLPAIVYFAYEHPPIEKPKTGRDVVACVGDSITFGSGVLPIRKKAAWPALLGEMLPDREVLNYGFDNRTMQYEGNYPYTAEKMYPVTLEIRAKDYIVMLGSNDAKEVNWNPERYERDSEDFLRRYVKISGKEHVIVMKPPKSFKRFGKDPFGIPDEKIAEAGQIIERVAGKLGIRVIDLYAFTKDHPEWFVDGVHPNIRGNRAIAEYILNSSGLGP